MWVSHTQKSYENCGRFVRPSGGAGPHPPSAVGQGPTLQPAGVSWARAVTPASCRPRAAETAALNKRDPFAGELLMWGSPDAEEG